MAPEILRKQKYDGVIHRALDPEASGGTMGSQYDKAELVIFFVANLDDFDATQVRGARYPQESGVRWGPGMIASNLFWYAKF